MKTMMLLLISAAALIASPIDQAVTNHNLKRVYDLAQNYTESANADMLAAFVESVKDLAEGSNKCERKFFCKVQHILADSTHFGRNTEIVKILEVENEKHTATCEEVKKKKANDSEITVKAFLDHLIKCIQHKNIHEGSS